MLHAGSASVEKAYMKRILQVPTMDKSKKLEARV